MITPYRLCLIKHANIMDKISEAMSSPEDVSNVAWGLGGLGIGSLGTLGLQYLLAKKKEEDIRNTMTTSYDPYTQQEYFNG